MVATKTYEVSYQQQLLEKATAYLPGTTLGAFYLPPEVACVIRRGQGSKVWDVAGREYIDYLLGSGPLLLGHAHPALLQAVQDQLALGSTYFYLNEPAILLAEKVVQAVPCAEAVKFTNSGTEATFHALRIARAYTGRTKILKFEGGYHGQHDYGMQSSTSAHVLDYPLPVADSAGIPGSVSADVLIAPFNNAEVACDIIAKHASELAAVIAEPLQRAIKPKPGFLEAIRKVTKEKGIVLIFDEIVTGFRLAWGGAQERYGVVPDLATLGKALSGGFSLAAVCGRREVMAVTDPHRKGQADYAFHSGTLTGNPLATAAGLAILAELQKEGVYPRLQAVGDKLRSGLEKLGAQLGIPVQAPGDGPLFEPFFTDQEIVDYRACLASDKKKANRFGVEVIKRGLFVNPGSKFYISLAHTDADLDRTLQIFEDALRAL